MKVAVTGATGFIGRHLTAALSSRGHEVIALTHRSQPSSAGMQNITFTSADIGDLPSLVRAFGAADVVYHLVGIIAETRASTFEKTIVEGTRNVIEACRRNGVNKIIYLSALGTTATSASRYHQAKWAAEEAVRNSGLEYVILRPSIVFGPDDRFLNTLAGMIKLTPIIPVIGDGRYQLQPIAVDDLAETLAACLVNESPWGKTIELGGPEKFEFLEIMSLLQKILGKKRMNFHVPLWLIRLNTALLERIVKPAPITTDQIKMLEAGNTCDNSEFDRIFGIRLTELEDGLRKYMR